ncbi:hypothetical protein CHARACLAT_008867 [Characodon lateralis]|uniref:Uncharacterized protein n=1 Tax=Characodon lateralis TaxID=208331 RepID=A0ABU7D884_9TELE|nr:hypothetical protein [Characodon lateralis]
METLASGMSRCSHVSVKHIKLHFRYSLWLLASAVNSSILLAIDLTLPMETEGRDGLNLLHKPLLLLPYCSPPLFVSSSATTMCPSPVLFRDCFGSGHHACWVQRNQQIPHVNNVAKLLCLAE